MERPDYSFYVLTDTQQVAFDDLNDPAVQEAAKEANTGQFYLSDEGMLAVRVTPINAQGACRYEAGWINGMAAPDNFLVYSQHSPLPVLIGDDGLVYDYRCSAQAYSPVLNMRVRRTALAADAQPEALWETAYSYDLNMLEWVAPEDAINGVPSARDIYYRSGLGWDQGMVLAVLYGFNWLNTHSQWQRAHAIEALRDGSRSSAGVASGYAGPASEVRIGRSPGGMGVARFADGSVQVFHVAEFEGYT